MPGRVIISNRVPTNEPELGQFVQQEFQKRADAIARLKNSSESR